MDDKGLYQFARFTATNAAATLWPPATNPLAQPSGVLAISRDDPRLSPWPCVDCGFQLPRQFIDEALGRIESGEVPAPSPDLYDLAGDKVFAHAMSWFGDAVDDGKNPYLSGIPLAVQMFHTVRLLHQGRPAVGEDVRYLSQVGLRFAFHSRSERPLRVEPGLVESRYWAGNFYLSSPLWPFTLSGHDLLDSGRTLASRLSGHGIVCDAGELGEWLQSGLRNRLQSQAYPGDCSRQDCEGGAL